MMVKKIEELNNARYDSNGTFARDFPELASIWSTARNCGFRPEQFSRGSNIAVWFQCKDCGVEFQRPINSIVASARNGKSGCPACSKMRLVPGNKLIGKYPDIAKEYCQERNILPLEMVTFGSRRKVWWACASCAFEWQMAVLVRTRSHSRCPNCSRAEVINLKGTGYYKYFDKSANGAMDPERITIKHMVAWVCEKGSDHRWQATLPKSWRKLEKKQEFCPFCRGVRLCKTNALTAYPEIAKQLDERANNGLKPTEVSVASPARLWWTCSEGPDHKWLERVSVRTKHRLGCPYCASRRLSVTNSLVKVAPDLAKRWHPTKNGDVKAADVVAYTCKAGWFVCDKGHEYETEIRRAAIAGSGCPECRLDGLRERTRRG